jgi:hypothetical protein
MGRSLSSQCDKLVNTDNWYFVCTLMVLVWWLNVPTFRRNVLLVPSERLNSFTGCRSDMEEEHMWTVRGSSVSQSVSQSVCHSYGRRKVGTGWPEPMRVKTSQNCPIFWATPEGHVSMWLLTAAFTRTNHHHEHGCNTSLHSATTRFKNHQFADNQTETSKTDNLFMLSGFTSSRKICVPSLAAGS